MKESREVWDTVKAKHLQIIFHIEIIHLIILASLSKDRKGIFAPHCNVLILSPLKSTFSSQVLAIKLYLPRLSLNKGERELTYIVN